jgi:hypothetical protein
MDAKTRDIIRKAEGRGIVFTNREEKLLVRYPEGEKTLKVENWIRDNKSEILAYLADPYRDGLGLKWAIVNSRVLGEEVVFAKEGAEPPSSVTEGRVVYFEGELRVLLAENATEGHLRHIHEVKKNFGGTIEQQEEETRKI